MKTCKKILAGILVFAMMMSMCAFVSADEVAETPTSKLVSIHNFDGIAAGTTKTQTGTSAGAANFDKQSDSPAGSAFFLKGKANNGSATIVEKAEGDNYLSTDHTNIGYNHRVANVSGVSGATGDFVSLGYGEDFPVLHFEYDFMIPADDLYKHNRRTFTYQIGTTGAAAYGSNVGSYTVVVNDGVVTAGGGSAADETKNGAVKYTYGKWMNIDCYAWISSSTTMEIAVFADGQLVRRATSSSGKTITGMATNSVAFFYYNDKANSQTLATYDDTTIATNGANAIKSITNYDNIIVELLPASSVADADTLIAAEYTKLLNFKADKFGTVSDNYSANAVDSEDGTVRTITAKKAAEILYSDAALGTTIMQGSATLANTPYTLVTDEAAARKYITATSAKYVYLVNNVRRSLKSYIDEGTNTLVFSYDTYVPAGTESTTRFNDLGFALDSAATGTYARKVNDLTIESTILNGEISFNVKAENQGTNVAGALRSETRTVPSDTWITVYYIMDVTHAEDCYKVKVWGVYNNEVIYQNAHEIEYADFDADDVADDLRVNQTTYRSTPPTGNTADIVTPYDEIRFALDNNFDWSGINKNAWVNRRVELALDADGNVDVEARKSEGAFADGILVIALYNANGKLVEIIKLEDIADGKFVYEIPAAKVATAKMVKGFIFDGITTAVPQFPSGVLVIE